MIGLDTNVLVRYATQDDPRQSALADKAIEALTEQAPGFVSTVVVAECAWVLRSTYRVGTPEIANFVRHLLEAREVVVERADAVRRALVATGGDGRFTDALITEIGIDAGCDYTFTFDRRAAEFPGGRLLAGK